MRMRACALAADGRTRATTAGGLLGGAARELASDRFIGLGTWRWIDLHAHHGGQPVYRYYDTHPRPASKAGAGNGAPVMVLGQEAKAEAASDGAHHAFHEQLLQP